VTAASSKHQHKPNKLHGENCKILTDEKYLNEFRSLYCDLSVVLVDFPGHCRLMSKQTWNMPLPPFPTPFPGHCRLMSKQTWNMTLPPFPTPFPVTFILLSELCSVHVKLSLRMNRYQTMRAYGEILLPVDIIYPCISAVDRNQWSPLHRFTIYESALSVPLAIIHNWPQKEISLSPLF
jgi:hypothetical protein